MEAHHCKFTLKFKRPSGTSRGVLTSKDSYFIILKQGDNYGIGECGLLKGLSVDDLETYEATLSEICENIQAGLPGLLAQSKLFPSIQFGLEQAFLSLEAEDPFVLFPSTFTEGHSSIPINGLIWMGEETYLYRQLEQKIKAGFRCIKLKVGALDFDTEIRFLENLRKSYPADKVELRLDANGSFSPDDAIEKLNIFSQYNIHSIEQPIARGQWSAMAELCHSSPLDIALDEELIGIFDLSEKSKLLQTIRPHYIILKPSLLGGFASCQEWIDLADNSDVGWWITSALESNIGLNAIAQWTYVLATNKYQGLGTGGLYNNNFDSPLQIERGMLYYDQRQEWPADLIQELCL